MSRVLALGLTVSLLLPVQPVSADPGDFIRGDCDGNGMYNALVDTLFILAYQFQNGPTPPCLEAADVDGNGEINGLIEALYMLNFMSATCCPPPAPFPSCGPDPDPADSLGCETHPCF